MDTPARATYVPYAGVPKGQSRSLTDKSAPMIRTDVRPGQPAGRATDLPSWPCGSDSRHPLFRRSSGDLLGCLFAIAAAFDWHRMPVACPTALRSRPVSRCRCPRFQCRSRLCPQVKALSRPSAGTPPGLLHSRHSWWFAGRRHSPSRRESLPSESLGSVPAARSQKLSGLALTVTISTSPSVP